LSAYPRLIGESEAFFHRWGTLAVFFARFVAPVRAFVPITAGALGMTPWKFYVVNAVAILFWAAAHTLPGVLAVSALHRFAGLSLHEHVGKHLWIYAVVGGAVRLGPGGKTFGKALTPWPGATLMDLLPDFVGIETNDGATLCGYLPRVTDSIPAESWPLYDADGTTLVARMVPYQDCVPVEPAETTP
jgi:hypothetical protein